MANRLLISLEALLWRWMNFSRRRRITVFAFWILLTALSGWTAATNLGVNTDTSAMISSRLDYRQQQIAFEHAFPALEDQILILVRSDSQDGAERFAENLYLRLREREDVIHDAFAPALDPFFQKNGLLFQDTDELTATLARLSRAAPLIERLNQDPGIDAFFSSLARAFERDITNPAEADALTRIQNGLADVLEAQMRGESHLLSWRALFADEDDGPPYQTLITVWPQLDYSLIRPVRPVEELISQVIEETRQIIPFEADVFVTGDPVLRSDELRTVSEGVGLAFMISAVAVLILLSISLRSNLLSAVTFLTILASITSVAALAAMFTDGLNLVSVAFTVLMVGLGVDFSIHLAMHAQAERKRGISPRAALYRTAREIGAALTLTAPTTSLAFFAFVPTAFTGMAQMGVLAGSGVLVAFAAATSLIPASLSLMGRTDARIATASGPPRTPGRRRFLIRIFTPVIIILSGLSILLMPQVRFDADPMSLRSLKAPSVQAFDRLFDDPDTAPYRLSLLTADMSAAREAAERLEPLPETHNTLTLLDFVPEHQNEKLELIDFAAVGLDFALAENPPARDYGEEDSFQTLLEALDLNDDSASVRLAAAMRAFSGAASSNAALWDAAEADLLAHWPFELVRLRLLLQADIVSLNDIPSSVTRRYAAPDGRMRVEISPAQDVRDPLLRRQFIEAVRQFEPDVTGSALTVMESGRTISLSMLQAALTALAGVSLLLYITLRSVRLILAMMIPLIMAGLLTAASGVILNMPFNFANVIVLPLLIGLGIDSGIHLAMRAWKSGRPALVLHTTTPRAVFFSAVTTIASFGSLMIAEHRGTASMGALLTIALFWTLVCTILVLPGVMDTLMRGKTPPGQHITDGSKT